MLEINQTIIMTPIYQILLDLQRELKYIGNPLLHTIRPPKYNNADIIVSCPVHKHGTERHPSASITSTAKKDVPAGFMYCFSCKAKLTIDNLISFCFGYNDNGVYGRDWLLKNYANYEIESRQGMLTIPTRKVEEQTYITEEELESYRYTHPYMYKRHLTDDIIDIYDIGYDKNFMLGQGIVPSITFPVKDEKGRVVFIARRSIKGKIFSYPKTSFKGLYGIYECKKLFPNDTTLFVCESIFNCLSIIRWGKPAIALLGTGSKEQYDLLKCVPYKKLILCLDNDDAGTRGTLKLIKALSEYKLLEIWQIKKEGKDINDIANLSYEEFIAQNNIYGIGEFYEENPI